MIGPLEIAELASERDVSRYQDAKRVRLPSVTEILALAGMVDLGGIPVDRLQAASQRGRTVHALCADIARGNEVTVPPALGPYIRAYLNLRDDTGFTPLLVETALVSQRYRFAGTPDLVGTADDGRMIVADLKTAATPQHWWPLQLSGYELLVQESGLPLDCALIERWSVQLCPDGKYALHPYPSIRRHVDRADFLAALRVASYLLRTRRYVLT